MSVIDFTNLPKRNKMYAGANGSKISVIYDGQQYMLKFPPMPTKNKDMSYSNSCFSEYLGCQIYESIGVPVQKTMLGTYTVRGKEKIVVACGDFTEPGVTLQDFASLKNQMIDSVRNGYGTELSDILYNATVSTVLTLICLLASLAVLYPNLAELSNVSENNPRAKSLKAVTIFNVGFVIIIVLIALAFERLESRGLLTGIFGNLSESQLNTLSKLFMALILAVPMLFFGNVAPQIPFNRYTGLRLPWTVRDEETWIVAHRVLGYVSFPIAILVFVNVPTNMLLDTYVKFWWLGAVVLWIAIPGLISALFYYRKWHGKP